MFSIEGRHELVPVAGSLYNAYINPNPGAYYMGNWAARDCWVLLVLTFVLPSMLDIVGPE